MPSEWAKQQVRAALEAGVRRGTTTASDDMADLVDRVRREALEEAAMAADKQAENEQDGDELMIESEWLEGYVGGC